MNEAETGQQNEEARATVIDPTKLDISETVQGVLLHIGEQAILLPDGTPVGHSRRTLIEHIREEFSGFGTISLDTSGRVVEPDIISAYSLLGVQQEFEGEAQHPFVAEFAKWLLLDPCLSRCAGPEADDQLRRWMPLRNFYETNGLTAPDFPQIPIELDDGDDAESVVRKRCLMASDEADETGYVEEAVAFAEAVSEIFSRLGPEEWTAVYYLYRCHNVILFPLLLAAGKCTTTEYANGVMAAHVILTTIIGDVDAEAHAKQARAFREDAQIVLAYLENARSPWAREIFEGEGDTREFKATMRYDLKSSENNKELEHSLLKNVAAFLNTSGGTVFVGVSDDREIVGIELDGFSNNDKWSLHLINRIGQQIGKRFLTLCEVEFDVLHSRAVARISIRPSDEPAYLDERALLPKGKRNALFIRGGPSAQKLTPEEVPKYLEKRFSPQTP